jgi:O-antigen ligase
MTAKTSQAAEPKGPLIYLQVLAGLCGLYFLFATSSGFGLDATWHDEQRLLQVYLLLFASITIVMLAWSRQGSAVVPSMSGALVATMVIAVCSGLLASRPPLAGIEIALFLGLVALASCFAAFLRLGGASARQAIMYGVLLLAGTQVFTVGARYVSAILVGMPIDVDTLTTGFANRRFASAYYAVLMPLLAGLAAQVDVRRSTRLAALTGLSFLLAINLGLGTRAIAFAFVLSTALTVVILGWSRARATVAAMLMAVAFGAVLHFALLQWLPAAMGWSVSTHAGRMAELDHTSGRWGLWMAAWEAFLVHPWLGIGPMHYATIPTLGAAHPHSWLAQWGAEIGLLGLSAAAAAMVGLALAGRRSVLLASSSDAWLSVGSYYSVMTAIVYGLVDGNFVMPVSQSAIAVVVGLLLGTGPASHASRGAGWQAAACLVALIPLAAYTAHHFDKQSESANRYMQETGKNEVPPRFWQQGRYAR